MSTFISVLDVSWAYVTSEAVRHGLVPPDHTAGLCTHLEQRRLRAITKASDVEGCLGPTESLCAGVCGPSPKERVGIKDFPYGDYMRARAMFSLLQSLLCSYMCETMLTDSFSAFIQ